MPCFRIFRPRWEILEIFIRESIPRCHCFSNQNSPRCFSFHGIVFDMQLLYCRIREDEERTCVPCICIFHRGKSSRFSLENRSRNVAPRARILLVASLFKELYSTCSFSVVEFAKMKRDLSCLALVFSIHREKSSKFSLENSEVSLFFEPEFSSLHLFLRNCIRHAVSLFSNS